MKSVKINYCLSVNVLLTIIRIELSLHVGPRVVLDYLIINLSLEIVKATVLVTIYYFEYKAPKINGWFT